ncbi:hypothetical protein KUW19_00755 [Ferrimonas balearica]|uniref:hypothetical protein n=1 Tax=Ferrimonas balearica TaxID=44012 RepID=UPI001C956450|nr:hypothetical protein [Ferrimonas balearica]MBY6105006.1 hypothetical protein [Ferrimonas balearica]
MPNVRFEDQDGEFVLTLGDAVAYMQARALERGGCYLSDRFALDDFFALHWAVETTKPTNCRVIDGLIKKESENER